MKAWLIIFTGLLSAGVIRSQDLFLRVYDFPVSIKATSVEIYNGRIFAAANLPCDFTECSLLVEIDMNGDTLWTTLIPDIDIAPGTMVIVNDTITVTGNNAANNTSFRMAHFTLNGEKIGETIKIDHPTRKFTRMFQLTTQYFNGSYIICGPGWEGDTAWSLMYVVDKSGTLDTLITIEPTNAQSDIWDSFIDHEGMLTTIHQVEWAFSDVNYRRIYKFDTNYDTVWSYKTENDQYDPVIPYGCGLLDGRTILSVRHPQGGRIIHSIRAINADKITSWQYNYPSSGSKGRYVLKLKTLSNGDILGSGLYSEMAQDPRISDSPWLFRMSPDGDLLWERTYFDIDSSIGSDGSSRLGVINDFIELENGNIVAVGYLRYDNNDMLIMRVDSNGCLDPEDCSTVNILTKTEDISVASMKLLLYPNPVADQLNVQIETKDYNLDIHVLDILGRIVTTSQLMDGYSSLNVELLQPGLYIVNVMKGRNIIATGRFLKIN